jgi:cobalt/nickel transport system permease protein
LLSGNKPPRKTSGFIDRTLLDIVSLVKETVSDDETALRNGFLQRCDARIKFLTIVVVVISALSTRSICAAGLLYLATIGLAFASAIPMKIFFKRTVLVVPLFSLFIIAPAIFRVVTPGDTLVDFKPGPFDLTITRQGIDVAILFFIRVLTSVSLVVLLVLTTRHHILLKVLRILRVPKLFVMTIGMTYRYIYLLLDIIQNTFTAVKSRVGYISSTKTGRHIVTSNMAGLWLKSYRLQTQVYSAMLSRGYTGEPRILEEFHVRMIDLIFLSCTVGVLIGVLWLNRYFV